MFAFTFAPCAFANGAFPEARQLLFRAERPNEMIIAANYGLLISEDSGKTWDYVCEAPLLTNASLYQLGTGSRLLAVSANGLVYSDDQGCTWRRSGGSLNEAKAVDAFVYPIDPMRVVAVAQRSDESCVAFESTDGGVTFGPALFSLPAPCILGGVEISTKDPNVLYLSGSTYESAEPVGALWRSADAGKTWVKHALGGELAQSYVRIISVDPQDANHVLLRASPFSNRDRVALTTNGGVSFTKVLDIEGMFSAFLRTQAGDLLLAATGSQAFLSRNKGQSFEPWSANVSAHALAERDGRVYALTNPIADGALLARTADRGQTWERLLQSGDVHGIKACVAHECQDECGYYAQLRMWSANACTVDAGGAPPSNDAGVVPVRSSPEPSSSACSYASGRLTTFGASSLLTLLLCATTLARRNAAFRRRPRARLFNGSAVHD